ncbi:MAG: hypothetical protein ACK5NK_03580 [Niabella sp.]
MKKTLFTAVAAFLFTTFVNAQAYEGSLKIKKVEEPAIVMVYNYSEDIVENAFKAALADKRLKGDKSKGFLVYNRSIISDISGTPLDYSFKFDEKGKKGKESTTVYMLMKGDNSLSNDPATVSINAKLFLENMIPHVGKSYLIFEIKRQEDVLVKEEKKLKSLQDDHSDLEKKLKDNESKQGSQEKVIESQQRILSDLKAKSNS